MLRNIIIAIFILASFSCQEKIPAKNKIAYTTLSNSAINDISHKQILFDTLRIYTGEGDSLSSMFGFFYLTNDTIVFADRQLSSVLFYNEDGKFLGSQLKRGRGPNEILSLDRITSFSNHYCATLDGNGYLSLFNPKWEKINQSELCWYKNKNAKQIDSLKKIIDANEFSIYSFNYEGLNIKPLGNKHLLIPIDIELPQINAYTANAAAYYYENASTLGIIDIDSGQLHQIMCPRSPVYLEKQFLPNFRTVLYDLKDDTLFFSFNIDELIYKMIISQQKVIQAYGIKGRNMYTDYHATSNFQEPWDNYGEDMKKYGFYTYLNYISETATLFRSYRKGRNSTTEGLQIYRKNKLIYDIDVPTDFEVFGYRQPYYYAKSASDNDKEEMLIYKFQLN